MAFGYKNQSTLSSLRLKSSTTTSIVSIRSSFSSSTSISTRMKSFTARAGVDTKTENALIKEIYEQFLVCKFCLKPFTRPKTLNCLHTFCEECLTKYRDSELEGSRYVSYSMRSRLICPICTKKTDLPPGGIRRLQDSFLLASLNQVVSRVSRSSKSSPAAPFHSSNGEEDPETLSEDKLTNSDRKIWCGICSKGNSDDQMSSSLLSYDSNTTDSRAASYASSRKFSRNVDSPQFQENLPGPTLSSTTSLASDDGFTRKEAAVECLDCSAKLLCRDCADMHMCTEVTQNHSLVGIGLARQGKLQCSDHVQEMVRFYCESCEKCICILCTFNDHKTHKIVTFSESVKIQLQSLESRFHDCKQTYETMKEHYDIIAGFESKVATAEGIIREKSNELMKIVKEKEEELLNELKVVVGNDEVASFLEQKPQLEQMLSNMESTFLEAESLLKNKNVEIILMKNKMDEDMKHFLEWTSKSVPQRLTDPLTFAPHATEISFGVFRTRAESPEEFGILSTDVGSCDKSTSEVMESIFLSDPSKRSANVQCTRETVEESYQASDLEIDTEPTASARKDAVDQITRISNVCVFPNASVGIPENNETPRSSDGPFISRRLSSSSTMTDHLECDEKSTMTNRLSLQVVNKGVSTITLSTSDKGVGTVTTNVSSAYRDLVDAKSPKQVVVSRGTMTSWAHSEHPAKRDSSTSPIRILQQDKSTMASKAELAEPKDVFCRPGLDGKPKKITESMSTSARLDSINEGSDEDRSSGEEAKIEPSPVPPKPPQVGSPKPINRSTPSRPLPTFVNQRSLTPNSAIVYPLASRRAGPVLGEKFKPSFNAGNKLTPLKCHEVGINTESVMSHNKSTGTDSPPIFEKMAECINKLKTVRHRLECIQSPASSMISSDSKDFASATSKITESISSSLETATSDNDNGLAVTLSESIESHFSAKDVKKYILSVDAGGSSTKKPKPPQPQSPGARRQRTPTSSGPGQSVAGNDNSNSSGGSSTSNSPSIQRSGKTSRLPAENTSSKSPKFSRAKIKSQQDAPGSKVRHSNTKTTNRNKISSGLTDLSDSLHSESSEECDKCGSGESFAGVSGTLALESDRSFGTSLKQRLASSSSSAKKQKSDLIKSINSRNKSPRPPRRF